MKIDEQKLLTGLSQLTTAEDILHALEALFGKVAEDQWMQKYAYGEIERTLQRMRTGIIMVADALSDAGLNVSTAYLDMLRNS